MITLAEAEALDAADPLHGLRHRFRLPEGVIYLDGNSLGPLPAATSARVAEAVSRDWGIGLVRSWNDADWIGAPARLGDKIARLIGAHAGEVIVADSTSVDLFKLIAAGCELAPDRNAVLVEAGDFPTDLHVARRAAELLGRRLVACPPGGIEAAFGPDVAVAVLSHVHYRSGARHDIAAATAHARASGIRLIWDLSHSAGAVPLDMTRDGVELAVGCGYKFLNGGPGAPAFLFVAGALQARMRSPIAGWLGHAAPFAFQDGWQPAPGIARFQAGTPPILSLVALEAGIDATHDIDRDALWAKSVALFDLFAALAAERCPAMPIVTPCDPPSRGSQISLRHGNAHEIVRALIDLGIIGDFRAPDIARFGLTPLYLGFADVWRAVEGLATVLDRALWRNPDYARRATVT